MDRFSSLALRPLEDLINHGIAKAPGAQAAGRSADVLPPMFQRDQWNITPVAPNQICHPDLTDCSQIRISGIHPGRSAGVLLC